jgi:indolepyruvate ferredoxin oxidoreductase alpha subunit
LGGFALIKSVKIRLIRANPCAIFLMITNGIKMNEKILTGDQAIAQGAVEADVRVVTGYPGSPGTKVLTGILDLSKDNPNRHIEWSANEKVAFEIALGASIGGDRAIVCLKSVGMNITIDPIMTANLTGINAGLVILLGDDPGALLSQNEQDTRLIMDFIELPLMEPSTPQEAKDMIISAFDMSEEFQSIFIVREIRTFSIMKGSVKTEETKEIESKGFVRQKNRWISTTFNVLNNHEKLHDKLNRIELRFRNSEFNKAIGDGCNKCVIAAGFSYTKLMDVLGSKTDGLGILKLGTIYPLPETTITHFLRSASQVLVLEDNEPYVENKIKSICHDAGLDVEVIGKTSGHIPRVDEVFKQDITSVLVSEFGLDLANSDRSEQRAINKGELEKTFCDDCPYTPTFEILSKVLDELGEKPIIISEPGCSVRLNAPPFEMLDVKYSMGSAIGIASGLAWSRTKNKPIAVCGDSSFFHTGINALMNVIQNRASIFILVLDNSVAALTGYQTHPGTGYDITGKPTAKVEIADIARLCGIPYVDVVSPDDPDAMKSAFHKAMTDNDISLVVVKKPCPMIGK